MMDIEGGMEGRRPSELRGVFIVVVGTAMIPAKSLNLGFCANYDEISTGICWCWEGFKKIDFHPI